jgi:hypothetical protein
LGTQEVTMGAALQFGQSNAMNYSTTFREVGRMVFWIWQLKCRPLFLWEEELHSNLLGALASSRLSPRRILGCNKSRWRYVFVYGKGQLFILMPKACFIFILYLGSCSTRSIGGCLGELDSIKGCGFLLANVALSPFN